MDTLVHIMARTKSQTDKKLPTKKRKQRTTFLQGPSRRITQHQESSEGEPSSEAENSSAPTDENKQLVEAFRALFEAASSGLEATDRAAVLSRRKFAEAVRNAKASGVDFDATDRAADAAIIQLRDSKKLCLPRDTLEDIIREIGLLVRPGKGCRWTTGAIAAMHIATENLLVNFFVEANSHAKKNHRVTLKESDVHLAKAQFLSIMSTPQQSSAPNSDVA